jgi:hypothetical protein
LGLWAIGRYDLRLAEEELWQLMPEEFHALMQRKRERERREDMQVAMICLPLYESIRDPAKKATPFTLDDFMPTTGERGQQSPEEQMAILQAIAMRQEVR